LSKAYANRGINTYNIVFIMFFIVISKRQPADDRQSGKGFPPTEAAMPL